MPDFFPGQRITHATMFGGMRTGTYLGPATDINKYYCFVWWDDIEQIIAAQQRQYRDPEFVAFIRTNGNLVDARAIAKVDELPFVA